MNSFNKIYVFLFCFAIAFVCLGADILIGPGVMTLNGLDGDLEIAGLDGITVETNELSNRIEISADYENTSINGLIGDLSITTDGIIKNETNTFNNSIRIYSDFDPNKYIPYAQDFEDGYTSLTIGSRNDETVGSYSTVLGNNSSATSSYAIAIGTNTHANGDYSFAEGDGTLALGKGSHAEGYGGNKNYPEFGFLRGDANATTYLYLANTLRLFPNIGDVIYYKRTKTYATVIAIEPNYVEGSRYGWLITFDKTLSADSVVSTSYSPSGGIALGDYSHAEGYSSTASGKGSHAEGINSIASGDYSHAEGTGAHAKDNYSYVYDGDAYFYYSSHGDGTFNINPVGGLSGFWIGETNLNDHIDIKLAEGYIPYTQDDNDNLTSFTIGNRRESDVGEYSSAQGDNVVASAPYSHVEGFNSDSSGSYSHAEGYTTTTEGSYSHAEGYSSTASAQASHAEGYDSHTLGITSHAEGEKTLASGQSSHTEGISTTADAKFSHAEGYSTHTIWDDSFEPENQELFYEAPYGFANHAEGRETTVIGSFSHAEGGETVAFGVGSHSEGKKIAAIGNYSHADGVGVREPSTIQISGYANATTYTYKTNAPQTLPIVGTVISYDNNGYYDTVARITAIDTESETITVDKTLSDTDLENVEYYIWRGVAYGDYSHTEGTNNIAAGIASHAEGRQNKTEGDFSHAEGRSTVAIAKHSHAEGQGTQTSGDCSHAEGRGSQANGSYSHAEGFQTKANGSYSHAEGCSTVSTGNYSHAEGYHTKAVGLESHAEGILSESHGKQSHAEGNSTIAKGLYSHSEGDSTIAIGQSSHAEGGYSIAYGLDSHAEGGGSSIRPSYYILTGEANTKNYKYEREPGSATKIDPIPGMIILCTNETSEIYAKIKTLDTITPEDEDPYQIITLDKTLSTIGITNKPYSVCTGISYGPYSHTEGGYTVAGGLYSHAEGRYTTANADNSHAEGYYTKAFTPNSHAEGYYTVSSGTNSHAEGKFSESIGEASHAEGSETFSYGDYSHTEGHDTHAYGFASHAEGETTVAYNNMSHAEGGSSSYGSYSHAEGSSETFGHSSHAEGGNRSFGVYSHAEGNSDQTFAALNVRGTGWFSKSGDETFQLTLDQDSYDAGQYIKRGVVVILYDEETDKDYDYCVVTEVVMNPATPVFIVKVSSPLFININNINSTYKRIKVATIADRMDPYGFDYVSMGAIGDFSHAEGNNTAAFGIGSHSEGNSTTADGHYSHAEGFKTKATNDYAFVWNGDTNVANYGSHGDGTFNINPINGLNDFYIGETNLTDHIINIANVQEIASNIVSNVKEMIKTGWEEDGVYYKPEFRIIIPPETTFKLNNELLETYNISENLDRQWMIDNGYLEVNGSTITWLKNITKANIGTNVKNIDNAFAWCTNLVNVMIPDSVTNIGTSAFFGCRNLIDINIPDSVTSIGNNAFFGCGLTNIDIPDSVTSIGNNAYASCNNLTNLVIPDSVTSIGNLAFNNCDNLQNVIIGNGLVSIEVGAFGRCTNLTTVIIPNSIGTIGASAFAGCKNLTDINLPNSVTRIGSTAFSDCISLTNIIIPDSVTVIENQAFQNCSGLISITIPDSVTSIGNLAFDYCNNLTTVYYYQNDTETRVRDLIANTGYPDMDYLTFIQLP